LGPRAQEILTSLRTLPNESEPTLAARESPGHKPLVVNGVGVGPFEEEEEGTGVTKVEGADPATPGPLS